MRCKTERIQQDLESLSRFNLTPGSGCTRLSYTKEFSDARDYLKQRMAEAGLKVHEDPAGNIIGRYPGKVERPAVILTPFSTAEILTGKPEFALLLKLPG